MPNGKYDPQCFNCKFMASPPCQKHSFVFPAASLEVICRDFQIRDDFANDWHFDYVPKFLKSDQFVSLKPDWLYYFSNGSPLIPFEKFEDLKSVFYMVHLRREKEWFFYQDKFSVSEDSFPVAGINFLLDVDGEKIEFEVFEENIKIDAGGFREGRKVGGAWINKYSFEQLKVARPKDSSTFERLISSFYDLKGIEKERADNEFFKNSEIFEFLAFIRDVEKGKLYKFKFDELIWNKYVVKKNG
jgi:hypothetical protein